MDQLNRRLQNLQRSIEHINIILKDESISQEDRKNLEENKQEYQEEINKMLQNPTIY